MAKENILNRSIHELELDIRVMNGLLKYHEGYEDAKPLKTLRDLVSLSAGQLLRTPNFGRKSYKQLNEVLQSCDLKLGMTDEEIQDLDDSHKGFYAKLNYDIIRVSKENVGKTIDAILDKHKWSLEDVDALFKDHRRVLNVYEKALKELWKDE